MANNDASGTQTKHISIHYHFAWENIAKKLYSLEFCPTSEVAAALLTKPRPLVLLSKLEIKIGLSPKKWIEHVTQGECWLLFYFIPEQLDTFGMKSICGIQFCHPCSWHFRRYTRVVHDLDPYSILPRCTIWIRGDIWLTSLRAIVNNEYLQIPFFLNNSITNAKYWLSNLKMIILNKVEVQMFLFFGQSTVRMSAEKKKMLLSIVAKNDDWKEVYLVKFVLDEC